MSDDNKVYECPKCHNRLPVSNKMLHDLKCTVERPAEYSLQNPTASFSYNYDEDNDEDNNQNSNYALSKRNSIENDDGTITEIRKEKNMAGKEELLEITYDPQGNIIGRKKADGGTSNVRYKFRDMLDYKDDDLVETVYVYSGANVFVETLPTIEITYEEEPEYVSGPEQNQILYTDYGYKITNINPTSHHFGHRGYSLRNDAINNIANVNDNIYTSTETQYNTIDNVGFYNDTNFNSGNDYGISQNNYDFNNNYFENNFNNDYNFNSTNDYNTSTYNYSHQSVPVYPSYQSYTSPFATVTKINK